MREAALELDTMARGLGLLEKLQWDKSVELEFFARGADVLPNVTYAVDREAAHASRCALRDFRARLDRANPAGELLHRAAGSFEAAYGLLAQVETRAFYTTAVEQYGGAKTTALDGDTTNHDLAQHILRRLGASNESASSRRYSGLELRDRIQTRAAKDYPELELEFSFAPSLSAKVLAGMRRVRIREGAEFAYSELSGLYVHEVGTHLLTAQNGAAQVDLPFLRSGGPRTTLTQEGLAVFAELHDQSLSADRLVRIARRVELVGMVEDGADFLQLYRHLVGMGERPSDAFADASRIFRGAVLTGGAPFTKDACYLAGLVKVYNTLRTVVSRHDRGAVHDLVAGRVALEDLDLLAELRADGVLKPPRFVPRWVRNWDTLSAYFAFTSFLNEIDFASARPRVNKI
jgi:uncharacterized protein (TIGR02421 family)